MLCRDNNHRVVFLTERVEAKDEAFEGIYIKNFKAHREPSKDTHHYLNATEEAILKGQAVIRAITELKEEGFNPRVVINHGGMGLGLFIKDILPNSIQIGYFEWYFKPETTKHLVRDFNINTQLITGLRNMPILQELEGCDLCVTPTEWQKKQFPKAYSGKIEVIFDGIDDTFFKPSNSEEARSGELTLTNRDTKERYIIKSNEKIISYATRGMEPVRGFPEFMKMLPELLSTNNDLKVVIAGADRRAYSYDAPSHNGSWKEYMLSTIEDIKVKDRIMFTGLLDYQDYRALLWRTNLHCYLTKPYVTSWSLFEAAGCGARLAVNRNSATSGIVEEESVTWLDLESQNQMLKKMNEALTSGKNKHSKLLKKYSLTNSLVKWENIINKGLTNSVKREGY